MSGHPKNTASAGVLAVHVHAASPDAASLHSK